MKKALLLLLLTGCCRLGLESEFAQVAHQSDCRTGMNPQWWQEGSPYAISPGVQRLLQEPITEQDAACIALLNSPRLQAQFEMLGIARADFIQASLPNNPSFELAWRLPKAGNNIDASLLFPFSDLWQLPLRSRVGATALEIAKQEAVDSLLEVVSEAKLRFYQMAIAQEKCRLQQELCARSREIAGLTRYRQENGIEDELATALSSAALGERTIHLLEAKRSSAMAEQEFRYWLGLGDCYETLCLSYALDPPSREVPDAEQLVCEALHYNPMLCADTLRVKEAWQKVQLEKGRLFRNVGLGIGYVEEPDGGSGLGPALALEVPLFDQNQAQVSHAFYEWREKRRQLQDHQLDLARQIRELHTTYVTAQETLAVMAEEVLPSLDQGENFADFWSHNMRLTRLMGLEQQEALLLGQVQYLDLLWEAHSALIQLQRLVGYTPES